ncbi:MAG: hypothetical protein NVSMB18_07850 [Acetobacteraceae bacterium]
MRSQPTPTATPNDAAPSNPVANDAAYYRDTLHHIIDMGVIVARNVHVQAKTQLDAAENPTPTPTPDPAPAPVPTTAAPSAPALAAAFDRIARCIRRTIILARHLNDPPRAPAQNPRAARRRILRNVEDAILRRDPSPAEHDRLRAELHERLESPELAADLAEDIDLRPIDDIIAEICRDLGLTNLPGVQTHKRRTPADIAALSARAAKPAAPRPIPEPSPTNPPNPDPERLFRLIATPTPPNRRHEKPYPAGKRPGEGNPKPPPR